MSKKKKIIINKGTEIKIEEDELAFRHDDRISEWESIPSLLESVGFDCATTLDQIERIFHSWVQSAHTHCTVHTLSLPIISVHIWMIMIHARPLSKK